MRDFRAQLAQAMKDAREARGWRQKDVLDAARRLGADWSSNAISEMESGRRRADTLEELATLCLIFDTSAAELLGDRTFTFGGEESTAADLIEALQGTSGREPASELPGHARIGGDNPDEVRRLAAKVGVSTDELRVLVAAIYGAGARPIATRDRLAGVAQDDTTRSAQARRGHATRRIMREIHEAIDKEGAAALMERGNQLINERNRDAKNYLDNL